MAERWERLEEQKTRTTGEKMLAIECSSRDGGCGVVVPDPCLKF
jgi:hypothetical protein